eukprot:gene6859-13898_t
MASLNEKDGDVTRSVPPDVSPAILQTDASRLANVQHMLCWKCYRLFSSASPFTCMGCNRSYHKECMPVIAPNQDSSAQSASSSESLRCYDCIRNSSNLPKLKSNPGDITVTCPVCSKEFKTNSGYTYHVKKGVCTRRSDEDSPNLLLPQSSKVETVNGPYYCQMCAKEFRTIPGYNYHVKNSVCIRKRDGIFSPAASFVSSEMGLEQASASYEQGQGDGDDDTPDMKRTRFDGEIDEEEEVLEEVDENEEQVYIEDDDDNNNNNDNGNEEGEGDGVGEGNAANEPTDSKKRLKREIFRTHMDLTNGGVFTKPPHGIKGRNSPMDYMCLRLLSSWKNAHVATFATNAIIEKKKYLRSLPLWNIWDEHNGRRSINSSSSSSDGGDDSSGCRWESLSEWSLRCKIPLPTACIRIHTQSSINNTNGNNNSNNGNEPLLLRPYEGAIAVSSSSSSNNNNVDFLTNAGGPIWTISIAPTAMSTTTSVLASTSNSTVRHIAVGTSRVGFLTLEEAKNDSSQRNVSLGRYGVGSDANYVMGTKNHRSNLLQIWELELPNDIGGEGGGGVGVHGTTRNEEESSVAAAICCVSYFVEMKERGPVWAIHWREIEGDGGGGEGIGTVSSNESNSSHSPPTIGTVAVVCGDGSCLLMALPRLPSSSSSRLTSSSPGLEVLSEDSARICQLAVSDALVLSASWLSESVTTSQSSTSSSSGTDESRPKVVRLLGGLSDGAVCLWVLNLTSVSKEDSILPLRRFIDNQIDSSLPCLSAVRAVSTCPYQPELFASASYDGCFRIWNMEDSSKPVYVKKPHLGWLLDVQWDPMGHGLYCAGSDVPSVLWDSLWSELTNNVRKLPIYNHNSPHGAVWKILPIVHDDYTVTISVASDGSVRYAVVPITGSNIKGGCCTFGVNVSSQPFVLKSVGTEVVNTSGMTVVDIEVELRCSQIKTVEQKNKAGGVVLPDPAVALHAVDVSDCGGEDAEVDRFIAYGGTAGLMRVHSFDPSHYCTRIPL